MFQALRRVAAIGILTLLQVNGASAQNHETETWLIQNDIDAQAKVDASLLLASRCGLELSKQYRQQLEAWKARLNNEDLRRYETRLGAYNEQFSSLDLKKGDDKCSMIRDSFFIMLATKDAIPSWVNMAGKIQWLSQCGISVSKVVPHNIEVWRSTLTAEERAEYDDSLEEYVAWGLELDLSPGSSDCESLRKRNASLLEAAQD